MSGRGRFIALEGLDGSGKTTQARLLVESLGALYTAEPGGTDLGTRLRGLLLDPASPSVSGRAEVLLLLADRAQHLDEVVSPALESGRWVVTDRFTGSTLAYQGFGRGFAREDLVTLDAWATAGTTPDLVVLVDVPAEVALARRSGTPDRLERLGDDFRQRVREGYLALASSDPERWVVVDGSGDEGDVARCIYDVVSERLSPLPSEPR